MPNLDESDFRTSAENVRSGRFETDLDDNEILEHIDAANMAVDEHLENRGLSERRLERIERNLARHRIKFLVESERMTTKESTGPTSRTFAGAFDAEGLKATPYGQAAIEDDTSDTLGPDGGDFWSVTA